jgi:hypothetical protein
VKETSSVSFWIDHVFIGFEAFTTVTIKSTIFWGVDSCSPVEVHTRFGGILPPSSGSESIFAALGSLWVSVQACI